MCHLVLMVFRVLCSGFQSRRQLVLENLALRPHRSLEQDCPEPRAVEAPDQGNIIELPLVGGLHHRYARQAA